MEQPEEGTDAKVNEDTTIMEIYNEDDEER